METKKGSQLIYDYIQTTIEVHSWTLTKIITNWFTKQTNILESKEADRLINKFPIKHIAAQFIAFNFKRIL